MTLNILDQDILPDAQVDPDKDYLSELVGEGKKYKDVAALARSRVEADLHITRLEKEGSTHRQQIEESRSTKRLEEMVEQLTALQKKDEIVSPSNLDTKPNEQSTPQVTLSDVEKMIQERESRKVQEANRDTVRTRLLQEYGAEYPSKVQETANKLKVGVEFLNSVALSNPDAFYKLMDISPQKSTVHDTLGYSPPRSNVTPGFKPNSNNKNWAYWENMRKTEPAKYNSVSSQWEMDREAQRQGPSFYD